MALSAFSPAVPSALSHATVEVEYPRSDGKPLAEALGKNRQPASDAGGKRTHPVD